MEFTGLGRAVDRARAAGMRVIVATPRVGKPGEEPIDERILRLSPDGVLVRHFGALERCRRARADGQVLAMHGDFSLNVTNSLTAMHLLALGLDTVTASFDLDEVQLVAMLAAVPQPTDLVPRTILLYETSSLYIVTWIAFIIPPFLHYIRIK